MELQLARKTAVVTGAARGVGLAVCRAFLAEGATVVASSLTTSEALVRLGRDGGLSVVEGDLTDADVRRRLVDAADPVDVLVNTAGSAPTRPEGFLEVSDADWLRTFDLDLFAGVSLIRVALPGMVAAGSGVIVNVGSLGARVSDPLVIDHSAARAAFGSVARSLSKAYGPLGVRVSSVDPGPAVRTEGGAAGRPEPLSTPDEVAALVVLLASPRLGGVNGASFVLDEGVQSAV
jgi:NAD(P)-dependent dehydrogenase (short-subunit alcohol dehydrogenase family)